ncbi:MAG TPA: 3D domain-containing protein [Leptospiraceae bacterium]|nr:3D domain-containing protein [Leptospiraceae bacterium]
MKIIFSLTLLLFMFYNSRAQVGKEDFKTITVSASFYCHGSPSCKVKGSGKTATGDKVREGVIAVDPKVIPLKSKVEILEPEILKGSYTALDTGGGRIRGKFIDVWVSSQKEAVKKGIIKRVVLRVYPKNYKEPRKEENVPEQ